MYHPQIISNKLPETLQPLAFTDQRTPHQEKKSYFSGVNRKNRACSGVLHISKNRGWKWYWASSNLILFLEELEETNANITFLLRAGDWEWREPAPQWGRINQDREGAHRPFAVFLGDTVWRPKILHLGRTTLPPSLHSLPAWSVPAFMSLLHTVLYTGTLPSYLFPSIFILPLFTLGYLGLQKKKKWSVEEISTICSVTMHV